jgi:hypothetical protein
VYVRLLPALATALLGLGASPHTSAKVTVVVERTGFGQVSARAGSPYSFGVVLFNRSTTLDAVGVTVGVTVFGPKSIGAFYGQDFAIDVIPAGRRFVLGDAGGNLGLRITRVAAAVRVRALLPKHRQLPAVSAVRLDRKTGQVTATMANSYATAIDLYHASAYAVLFDRTGRVVGGGSASPLAQAVAGPSRLASGGYLPFGVSISSAPMSRVTRAEVSVNP